MEIQTPVQTSIDLSRVATQHDGCSCNKSKGLQEEKYVYAIGKLSVRWPSMGLEREFQQRQRALLHGSEGSNASIAQVLAANFHIAKFSCFVLSIDGIPAYIVRPTGSSILEKLIDALDPVNNEKWITIIGKRGQLADPAHTNGVIAPEMFCDVAYVFTVSQLMDNLVNQVKQILGSRKWDKSVFQQKGKNVFYTIVGSPDNLGSMDGQRALNYLAVQHPGPYLAAMEFDEKAILESIDTRVMEGPSGQRIATVILRFIDRLTGVPQQVYTKVDVTEEWPFTVGANLTDTAPLAMLNFTDASYS
ncbi:hypothetical protein [Flavihumibacter petaseus]|uniref:Uncharacterized protein n=1 Tax=Flavihumibacter petaseus NBRC 106054 TaxID=1220578 RepID=A0A0E9N242_9BACT|nr:hypothetical protein [Flavihumibacter petaseus]GAO44097.1 hypothetical protein FPE01S_03_01370 [Flavihumibacter petaseus NBRC 106054]